MVVTCVVRNFPECRVSPALFHLRRNNLDSTEMKVSVLILAVFLNLASCRRLSTRSVIDNEIHVNGHETKQIKRWMKITQAPSTEVRAVSGDVVEVECEATGYPAPAIEWYRRDRRLTDYEMLSNEINEYPQSGLAKVRARLHFNSIAKQHEGTYYCRAKSGGEEAIESSTIYVSAPTNFTQYIRQKIANRRYPTQARIVFYYTNYLENIGNDVELPCKAIGDPQPEIMWLDANGQIIENGNDPRMTVLPYGALRITTIRWKDMGLYTCVAKNDNNQDNITTFLYPMLAGK